jgi:trans-aconitate methyltransferase
MPESPYDADFYAGQSDLSAASARALLPLVFDLLHPARVVDFGCGVGTWLSVARELGAREVLGLDGDYVDRARLRIPKEQFRPVDLESPPTVAGHDLALSLEVAEHLSPAAAPRLLDALTGSAGAVLFGAAIPGQKGVHHVNCQWQSWWARQFAERGYLAFDVLRPAAWHREDVWYHYLQNTNLYLKRELYQGALAARLQPVEALRALDVVHPRAYLYYLEKYRGGLAGWWRGVRGRAV